MGQPDFADGDGCISDESSFYGDDSVRDDCESRARRALERPSEMSVALPARKRIKLDSPRSALISTTSTQQAKDEAGRNQDVVDFLATRPQVGALENGRRKDVAAAKPATPPGSADESGYVDVLNRRLGHDNAWQPGESVKAFLHRKPPSDPLTHTEDGWLWVESPKQLRAYVKSRAPSDMQTFMSHANTLLTKFETNQVSMEKKNFGKAAGTITRKMGPLRSQLESDLQALARRTSVTCGKWMLFPGIDDLPGFWRAVATATAEGQLGPMSKTGIFNPHEPETVICVYTYDFSDTTDVHRVLKKLVDLDLCSAHRKRIYYKCDAYTYLGINSKNDYKIRASLYSSMDFLLGAGSTLGNGTVARRKDRAEGFYKTFGDDL